MSGGRPAAVPVPRAARAPLTFLGALALAEAVAVGWGRHQLLPVSTIVEVLLRAGPDAMIAIGLVLVYRASRIINFAQYSLTVVAAVVYLTLQFMGVPWPLVALASVAAAVAGGLLLELCLLRRFASAPRLVVTVVTIAGGQLLVAAVALLPRWRFGYDLGGKVDQSNQYRVPTGPATSWFTRYGVKWFPVTLTGDHFVAAGVTILAVAGLAVFFKATNAGIAIRAAAENTEKAATLGIGTGRLSSLVWALAAGLAGLTCVTAEPVLHTTLTTIPAGLGLGVLLHALAAAVIGRMEDLPVTFAAALGIDLVAQAVFFSTTHTQYVDLVIFGIVMVALLVQRTTLGRVEQSITGGWAAAEEIRATPAILAGHPAVRTARRWILAAGLVVLVGYPWAMSPGQVFLGGTFAIFGIVAVSMVALTGWGGQISLGQFALVAAGASVGGALLAKGVPFVPAVLAGSLCGAAAALLLGLPALRIRGLFLAVTTLGFAVIFPEFFLDSERFSALVPSRVPRPRLFFVKSADERVFYYLCLLALAGAIAVALGLRRTRTGRVLIAMRDNERAAQALGLSLVRLRLTTFVIAGFLAGFAGALYAAHSHTVAPDAFVPDTSLLIFEMAVIGGLGSVSGVLTGAGYLALVQLFLPAGLAQQFAVGGGLAIVLLFFPAGIGGLLYAARDAFLRRIALRDKIYVPALLGDLGRLEREDARAPLAPKADSGVRVDEVPVYALQSAIAEAGRSQQGRGWVYG